MANSSFWKVALTIGILLSLVAFILGWIGFGVADWQEFQRYNTSIKEYYGLWAYCQEQNPLLSTVCKRWGTAEDQLFNGTRPNFIRTSEGLITTGMILLSLGLCVAFMAAALPLIAYVAALLSFMAFVFLVVGLPIFGRQSNDFSAQRGDYQYTKRYGFWLLVPTIVLEFLAFLFFVLAGILYKLFGYGNIATSVSSGDIYGGKKLLGGPNVISIPPSKGAMYGGMPNQMGGFDAFRPGFMEPSAISNIPLGPIQNPAFGFSSSPNMSLASYGRSSSLSSSPILGSNTMPVLLSDYIMHQAPRPAPIIVQASNMSELPQPSIIRATGMEPIPSATPAYLRVGEPVGPTYQPIINLTGQTLVGPIMQTK